MTTDETEPFATRLTPEEAAQIQEAVDKTELSRSDLLSLGFRYYMDQNPHDIPAFRPNDPDLGYLEQEGILPRQDNGEWTGIDER